MNWLSWKAWMQAETKLAQLADQLAAACQEQVWGIVRQQALAMSPAEARGYVRARAGLIVKATVEEEIDRARQWEKSGDRLRDLTTDQVVRLIGAQLRAVRPTRGFRHAA
jgi:hypothetical protein